MTPAVLAAGKVADLLLVDGNPLDSIAMVADRSNHRSVIKSGVAVYRRPAAKVAVAAE